MWFSPVFMDYCISIHTRRPPRCVYNTMYTDHSARSVTCITVHYNRHTILNVMIIFSEKDVTVRESRLYNQVVFR